MRIDTIEKLVMKNLFIYLYVAFSFGLIKCTILLTQVLYEYFVIKIDINSIFLSLYDWIAIPTTSKSIWSYKPTSILFYALTLASFGAFYGIGLGIIHRKKLSFVIKPYKNIKWFGLACLSITLTFNLFFLLTNRYNSFIFICWFFAFIGLCLLPVQSKISKISIKPWLYSTFTLAMALQFFLVFYPYLFKPVLLANDYMDIPEKTILSRHVVDNTSYINAHQIGGLNKYDPRIDDGKTPFPRHTAYTNLSPNTLLKSFLQNNKRSYRYFYANDKHILSLRGAMSVIELQELLAIYAGEHDDTKSINKLYFLSRDHVKLAQKKTYTTEEKDFITKNKMELGAQARVGWIFFHHSWILNPINAISLGANPQTQQLLYGWLNTVCLKHLMELWGDISYQSYFTASYLFYPVYYILFLITTFLIFRKIEYVAIGAALLSTSFFVLGDLLIRLAPGHNPSRHFFDLITFLLLYLYIKNNRFIYFFLSLALCIFSILWSKDFGICLLLSICATLILEQYTHATLSYPKIIFILLISFLGIGLYVLPIHGNCHNFIYSILGLGVPETPFALICILLLIINIGYLVYLSRIPKHNNPIYFLSLSLFLYCQLALIYYVWNSSIGHILTIASIVILLILTLVQLFVFRSKKQYRRPSYADLIFLLIMLFLYVPNAINFYLDRVAYNKIFTSHVIHDFNMQGAKFRSTMEPKLFAETRDLINRYDQHPYIYLISKYDAILPLIIKKYNALPSVSVGLDLISPVDSERFIHAIIQNNPKYIFIDTDINRNFNGDITETNSNILENSAASQNRVEMLVNMARLSHQLTKLYQPIEKGALITVYQKKS